MSAAAHRLFTPTTFTLIGNPNYSCLEDIVFGLLTYIGVNRYAGLVDHITLTVWTHLLIILIISHNIFLTKLCMLPTCPSFAFQESL